MEFDIPQDRFSCITIHSSKLKVASDVEFEERLSASIKKWMEDGVRGLWVKVRSKHSSLVPVCIKNGFEFHHAQKGYVMLKRWLSAKEPDVLPNYANQYLGCAGFVVNSKNQVLVIQERFHEQKHWKLPGGLADPGETIAEAAEREVLEETGVRCKFESVLCFRHQHHFRFGCSDFYFICLLKPLTDAITKCEQEIAAAQWMDVDEYMNHPSITETNRYFAEAYIYQCKQEKKLQHNLDDATSLSAVELCSKLRVHQVLSYNKKSWTQVYNVLPYGPDDGETSDETDPASATSKEKTSGESSSEVSPESDEN